MPFRPEPRAGGVGEGRLGLAGDLDSVLHAGHGVLLGGFRFPVEGTVAPVHQREDQVEVVRLHQLATVMQFVQAAHVADPRQTAERMLRRQVFAGVEDLVAEVAQQQGRGEQRGEVVVQQAEQAPGEQRAEAEDHHQPGREQDHPPVAGLFVAHLASDEEAVVVAGMALVEHPPQRVLVVAEGLVDAVLAPVEEHQRGRHRQPFQQARLLESGEEEDDPGAAVGEDEAGVQPGVVSGPDGRAVLLAKGLGIEGHGRHLACDCYWLGREPGRSAGAEGLAFECSDASLIRVMDK